jgi:hypothetical protein
MTRRLTQSTAYTVMLKLFLSSDHLSVATGKTVAIKLSKAGGAFANPNAGASNATEVSDGWYKFALDTTDTNTAGDLVIRATSASCDDSEQVMQVVPALISAADIADAVWDEALAGHATAGSAGAGLSAAGSAGDPWSTALPGSYGAGTAGKIIGDNIDAAISTRLATSGYTAPSNSDITAIKAKTDNLPSDPADESLVIAATNAIAALIGTPSVSVSADLAAVQAHGDTSWATASGFSTLDAAGVRAAVGMASADLDTQLDGIVTHGDGAWATASGFSTLTTGDIPTSDDNADALLDRAAGVETGWTIRQAMRIILSVLGGKVSGGGTGTESFRDMADSKDRVVATVDTDGNRTAITRDAT